MKNHRISATLIHKSRFINLFSFINISKIFRKEKRAILFSITRIKNFPKTKDQNSDPRSKEQKSKSSLPDEEQARRVAVVRIRKVVGAVKVEVAIVSLSVERILGGLP